jgi:hypothetical protein
MQGEIEPSMKERLESLKNLSMLTPSGILGMDFFPKTKYYSLNLTITWDEVHSYTPFEGVHSIQVPKTHETSRKSKKTECVVKWAAGGSLVTELANIRPREKWRKLSDDSDRIYFNRKYFWNRAAQEEQNDIINTLHDLQAQVENDTLHSVRLTLKVANVNVNTQKDILSGDVYVFVDGEMKPWFWSIDYMTRNGS